MGLDGAVAVVSGGEAQRVKLAKELSRRSTGQTLYILACPREGGKAHHRPAFQGRPQALRKRSWPQGLLLQRLVDQGNSVVVIEHNLDVIKRADWVLDLGLRAA